MECGKLSLSSWFIMQSRNPKARRTLPLRAAKYLDVRKVDNSRFGGFLGEIMVTGGWHFIGRGGVCLHVCRHTELRPWR